METESRKRTEALKKDEKKTTEQLSFPPLQETFIPPHPPSVFWQDFRSHIGYLSTADKQIVKNAFIIGEEAHKNQKRISGDPYFTHCIAVALSLSDVRADAETLVLALLHDAVEDTPLQLADINDRKFDFGCRVVMGVRVSLTAAGVGGYPARRGLYEFAPGDVKGFFRGVSFAAGGMIAGRRKAVPYKDIWRGAGPGTRRSVGKRMADNGERL